MSPSYFSGLQILFTSFDNSIYTNLMNNVKVFRTLAHTRESTSVRDCLFPSLPRLSSHCAISHVKIAAAMYLRETAASVRQNRIWVSTCYTHAHTHTHLWHILAHRYPDSPFVTILRITVFWYYGNMTFPEWKHSKCAIPTWDDVWI